MRHDVEIKRRNRDEAAHQLTRLTDELTTIKGHLQSLMVQHEELQASQLEIESSHEKLTAFNEVLAADLAAMTLLQEVGAGWCRRAISRPFWARSSTRRSPSPRLRWATSNCATLGRTF